MLVVGDSDAAAFAPFLEDQLDATGVAATTVDYKVSSGLARPDFFDWPAHLAATLPAVDPDIVVVTFGGNDAQGMSNPDGSNPMEWNDPVAATETWSPEYTRRAGEVMDLLGADGRTVVWVGIPNDDSPEMSARLAVQDEAVRAALATRPTVQFVDTWKRFSSRNGGWAEYVVDPRDGVGKDVRADDGFHLNQNGAEILALDIAEVVDVRPPRPRRPHLTPHDRLRPDPGRTGDQDPDENGGFRFRRLATPMRSWMPTSPGSPGNNTGSSAPSSSPPSRSPAPSCAPTAVTAG